MEDEVEKSAPCCSVSTVKKWAHRWARRTFTRKQLLRKLPILEWLPKYTMGMAVSDLIAGITVGLTVIPQGIAYALVAELPPQYGLYSAFMGCFVYCVFGSSKPVTVGPTALMALIVAKHVRDAGSADLAVLLAFVSGILIALLGILRLGFVIDFISAPVIAGFSSAAALTIASTQVKGLLGLSMSGRNASHVEGITGIWIDVIHSIDTVRYQDAVLGFACIVALLLLRALKDVKCKLKNMPPMWRLVLDKSIWFLSTSRNTIIVIICLGMAYALDPVLPDDPKSRKTTFVLTGNIPSGVPPVQVSPFHTSLHSKGGESLDFLGMISDLGSDIIVISLIAILESVAIAKVFAGGNPVDASQEMIALGLCNLVGSFFGSMPVTGSFSRTTVNMASGVRTPLGGIYTGVLVLLALAVLMPACAYIPKATLAAVIITAVIFSIECEVVRPMYRQKKSDLVCAFATFFTCLFWALEFGILVGVVLQACYVMYYTARPKLEVEESQLDAGDTKYLIVRMDRALLYPSVNFVRNLINKVGLRSRQGVLLPVVVDCRHVFATDFTGAKGFSSMVADFEMRQQPILFCNVRPAVEETLAGGSSGIVVAHSQLELTQRLQEIFRQNSLEEKEMEETGMANEAYSHCPENRIETSVL